MAAPVDVQVGPVRPEWAVEPSTHIAPVFPPLAFLRDMNCPLCGKPLTNGVPVSVSESGLAHSNCGGET